MCKCTPNIRTPFCGRAGCEWPVQISGPVDYLVNALEGIKADGTDHPQIEMHRRIAERALERYRAAVAVEGFAGFRSVKAPEFPRELPPDAVLVDAAEGRVLAVTVTDPETIKAIESQKLRGASVCYVENLPACGP